MKLNHRRVLTGLAATGVLGGALAGGGVALASTGSSPSPSAVTATAAAATRTAATAAAPASGRCDRGTAMRGLGGPGGAGGMWAGQPAMKAAAAYLGLSQDQLRSQLQSGKSLSVIATTKGKSLSGLEKAIIAAVTSQVNADTRLSAAQKAAMISQLKSRIGSIVSATRPSGPGRAGMGAPFGGGPMPGGMGGGPMPGGMGGGMGAM